MSKTGSYRKRDTVKNRGLLELNNGSQSCCFVHLNIFVNSRGSANSHSTFPLMDMALIAVQSILGDPGAVSRLGRKGGTKGLRGWVKR